MCQHCDFVLAELADSSGGSGVAGRLDRGGSADSGFPVALAVSVPSGPSLVGLGVSSAHGVSCQVVALGCPGGLVHGVSEVVEGPDGGAWAMIGFGLLPVEVRL